MKNTSRRASLCRKSDMRYPIRDKRSELAVKERYALWTALSSAMSASTLQL